MDSMKLNSHALRLLDAYGPKASVIAAQKARAFEEAGDAEQAATWRRIEVQVANLRRAEVP